MVEKNLLPKYKRVAETLIVRHKNEKNSPDCTYQRLTRRVPETGGKI